MWSEKIENSSSRFPTLLDKTFPLPPRSDGGVTRRNHLQIQIFFFFSSPEEKHYSRKWVHRRKHIGNWMCCPLFRPTSILPTQWCPFTSPRLPKSSISIQVITISMESTRPRWFLFLALFGWWESVGNVKKISTSVWFFFFHLFGFDQCLGILSPWVLIYFSW